MFLRVRYYSIAQLFLTREFVRKHFTRIKLVQKISRMLLRAIMYDIYVQLYDILLMQM